MGQRTLAFTKQMLTVFNFQNSKNQITWSLTLDLRFLEAKEQIANYSRRTTNTNMHKQTNICIYIRTLYHSNKNIIKHTKRNRVRYYGHARKKNYRTQSYGREDMTFMLNQY
jgi:hypothetical protein